MIDLGGVRRLALALPGAVDATDEKGIAITVGGEGFVWRYLVRTAPKTPRATLPGVIAVRCAIERKEMLIEAAPAVFFDDDHYRGFPAVLVRLDMVDKAQLAALLEGAWRLRAPKALVNPSTPGGLLRIEAPIAPAMVSGYLRPPT